MTFDPMPIPMLGGRPLVDRLWGACSGKFSFIISFQDDLGYCATWKNQSHSGPQPSNKIDGTPFDSYVAAETACKQTAKQLRRPA